MPCVVPWCDIRGDVQCRYCLHWCDDAGCLNEEVFHFRDFDPDEEGCELGEADPEKIRGME